MAKQQQVPGVHYFPAQQPGSQSAAQSARQHILGPLAGHVLVVDKVESSSGQVTAFVSRRIRLNTDGTYDDLGAIAQYLAAGILEGGPVSYGPPR